MKLNRHNIDCSSKLPIFILIIILAIGLNSYFFYTEFRIYSNHIETIQQVKDDAIWDCVKDEIGNVNQSQISDVKYLGKKIENSINKIYGDDLDSLKQNFIDESLDEKFYNMLKKELLLDSVKPNDSGSSENFSYYIGLKDRPIAHFSNIIDKFDSNNITWNNLFKNYGKNEKENLILINKIFTKDIESDILVLTKNSETINNFNMETLKNIYDLHGLEGFKEVTLFNVAYITEYGDIFNNGDYLFFDSINNYKLYLVKASSLYDLLYPEVYVRIRDIVDIYWCESNHGEASMTRKSIEYMTLNVILIIIALVISVFYNKNYIENKK